MGENVLRILFTSNNSELGGGETSLLKLMGELKKQYDVVLLTVADGELCKQARKLNIPVIIDNFKRKNLILTLIHIRKFLVGVDVIHHNECSAALLFGVLSRLCLFRKIPNYWTCHGQWYRFSKMKVWGIRHFVNSVFCVSRNVFNHLEKYGIKNKLLSHLGIDFEKSEDNNSIDLKKEFALSDVSLIITTVARFEPIKGQLKAIKAIERLNSCGYDISYFIVGGYFKVHDSAREYYESCKDYIQKSTYANKFFLLGERNDVPGIIRASDLVLVPSDRESLSMVTIEAVKEKTSVLTTPCQGPEEILEGYEFLICDENSSGGIYRKLYLYCSDESFRKKVDCSVDDVYESVRSKFDINRVANTYKKVFFR